MLSAQTSRCPQDGAEVFYVAPKFHDWEVYLEAFERRRILRQSLILSPGEVRGTLDHHGVSDGEHKIVYDGLRAYLCSEPLRLQPVRSADLAAKVRSSVEARAVPIGEVLERVYEGSEDRSAVRRARRAETRDDADRESFSIASDQGRQPELRRERFARLRESGRDQQEAIALAVGAEAWSLGAQLIFVTEGASD